MTGAFTPELHELDSHVALATPNDLTISGRMIGDRQRKPVRAVEHISRCELRPAIGDIEQSAIHQATIAAMNDYADS